MGSERPAVHAAPHRLARGSLGLFWLYQGFVPKIVRPSGESIELLTLAGVEAGIALDVLYGIGLAEIVLGLTLLSAPRWRWPLWLNLLLVGIYVLSTAVISPKHLLDAYSPAVVGLLIFPLSIVGLRAFPQRRRPVAESGAS